MTTIPICENTICPKDAPFAEFDIETLKLLHKHTYDRIMWYRSEIWRVATPIWSGYGAFLAAVLGTAIMMRKDTVQVPHLKIWLCTGTFVISILINSLFYAYVGRLYRSVDYLNNLMTQREMALSRRVGLFQKASGFMESDHTYIQHRVFPTLDLLFIVSNLVLMFAIMAIIVLILP